MANSTTQYRLSDGRVALDVTENKTLDLAQCGIVQNVVTDAITITLPATSAGATFTIRNGGVAKTSAAAGTGDDYSCLVTLSPNASDKIQGLGFTAADDKDALNTKATARVGDELVLVGDGTDGWLVVRARGIWARQS